MSARDEIFQIVFNYSNTLGPMQTRSIHIRVSWNVSSDKFVKTARNYLISFALFTQGSLCRIELFPEILWMVPLYALNIRIEECWCLINAYEVKLIM